MIAEMSVAAPDAAEQLGGALADLGIGLTGAVVDALGPQGTALGLVAADLALAVKSKAVRQAHAVAFRAAWRALLGLSLPQAMRPTREERKILRRLQPAHWRAHAEARGLAGTITGRPKLTPSGIVCAVRLDGTWTAGKLREAEPFVRNLIGCRTGLRMEIKAGKRGGWAEIRIRTRSAADGLDLTGWEPGAPWGIDTITGETVPVPKGRRMLVAGTSGSGKSWSARAVLADASEAPDERLVVVDPKRVEAMNWRHRARVAVTADEVLAVTDELVAEMHERLALIPRGRDVIKISKERPRITVFVDEGAEVISMARGKGYGRIIENLRTLARMARAAEIIVIWATQKPTMDKNGGIDPQVSAQITYRAALALSSAGESRVVFGEDATERGWHAHDLPMPGVAMLRSGPKARPHPIRTRAFSPADVIALPKRPIWHRSKADQDQKPTVQLSLVKDTAPDSESQVLAALAAGVDRVPALVEKTGLSRPTVYRALEELKRLGKAEQAGRGRYAAARVEVAR